MTRPWADQPPRGRFVDRPEPGHLLERARMVDQTTSRRRLQALFCVDAARWLAWPKELPAARELATELLRRPDPSDLASGSPAAAMLRHSLKLRADLSAGRHDDAVAALQDLPTGYPHKSRWVHWRDLVLATGDREAWAHTRRALAAELTAQGLPLSESLPVLMGRVEVPHWRAEGRLAARAADELAALLQAAEELGALGPHRRVVLASVGLGLVRLDRETAGGEVLHRAVADLPRHSLGGGARLFSRPAPEAAVWVRRAIDHALDAEAEPDLLDALLYRSHLALFRIAAAHRLPHVLVETAEPLPEPLARTEAGPALLTAGALAWLYCGESWTGHSWLLSGLRRVPRFRDTPPAAEALRNVVEWVDRTIDLTVFGVLVEQTRRMTGRARYELGAEVARLHARVGYRDLGWEQLTGVYRRLRSEHRETRARGAARCASTLLSWDHAAVALSLLRGILVGDESTEELPTNLASNAGSVESEQTRLKQQLAEPCDPAAAAATAEVLLHHGLTDLAHAAYDSAHAALLRSERPGERLVQMGSLANHIANAIDWQFRRDLQLAVEAEAADLLERLRVDELPG